MTDKGQHLDVSRHTLMLTWKPVSDERLDINFATGHHSNCCRVAVGVAENASDVHLLYYRVIHNRNCFFMIYNLTHGSIDNGHHNLGFAEANKDQAASRLGCHDPEPSVTE